MKILRHAQFVADPVVTPLTELTTIGTLHVICGFSALVLLPFAALLINLDVARGNPAVAPALRWTAGLPLAGVALHSFLSLAVPPEGWPPRLASSTIFATAFGYFGPPPWLLAWLLGQHPDQRIKRHSPSHRLSVAVAGSAGRPTGLSDHVWGRQSRPGSGRPRGAARRYPCVGSPLHRKDEMGDPVALYAYRRVGE
jgi:hypothetical protein